MYNIKGIIAAVVLLSITACGGEGVSNNYGDVAYINALNGQASFYVKKDSESASLFANKNKAVTLLRGSYSDPIRHKWFGYENSDFGVENTNNRDNQLSMEKSLRDSHDYWVIAWLEGNKTRLSLLKSTPSDRSDLYRVRIFANKELDVYVDGNQTKIFTTKVGDVSSFIDIKSCTGLVVGQNEIDLCKVDFGGSYLAVIDEEGLVSLVTEKS